MNKLWEQFVYVSLRKIKDATVTAQTSKHFWKPQGSNWPVRIKPDIVINKDKENCAVLDTKWKNLNGYNPSVDDLRQMYVYHEYFDAKHAALVYPGNFDNEKVGNYYPSFTYDKEDKDCSVIILAVPTDCEENKSIVKTWQLQISDRFTNWLHLK